MEIEIPEIPKLEETCWQCREPRPTYAYRTDFDEHEHRGSGQFNGAACGICAGKGAQPTAYGLAILALVKHFGDSK
jgi:hypothetical protein